MIIEATAKRSNKSIDGDRVTAARLPRHVIESIMPQECDVGTFEDRLLARVRQQSDHGDGLWPFGLVGGEGVHRAPRCLRAVVLPGRVEVARDQRFFN